MSFVELVLSAKTEGLKKGERALDHLADEGERTERRTKKSTGSIIKGFTSMGSTIAKAAGGAVLALASLQQASASIQQARGFNAAMAETSTLIEGTSVEMSLLSAEARQMAVDFGTGATAQVDAFYSAISGGADGVKGAAEILGVTNRLAIGGVTDVTTATKILNAALNVYADEGLTATEVSDALFVAMKAGETTIGQLASSLGKVLPFAQKVGVSFDEVAATTAALTKGGISTAESVTGIKASLVAVIRPTKDALDLARDLNLEFSVGALRAQGYAGFMQSVTDATGGSAEALATLFSSTEASAVAMTLAGAAGVTLGQTLLGMDGKTSQADAAFKKFAESFDYRWKKAASAAADVALRFGNIALTVVVPALESTAWALTFVTDNSDFLIASLGLLALKGIPAVVGGLVTLAGSTATTAAMFWTGAIAAQGLAFAINAIPFVVAATAATYVYRALRDSSKGSDIYKASLVGVTKAQEGLNAATERFYNDVTQANLTAMKTAGQAAVDSAKAALEAARAMLLTAGSTGLLDSMLPDMGRAAARVEAHKTAIAGLEAVYAKAEARLSAIGHRQIEFNLNGERSAEVAGTLTDEMIALSEETLSWWITSQEAAKTANEILQTYRDQEAITRAIMIYGEGSAEASASKWAEEERSLRTQIENLSVSRDMKQEIVDAAQAAFDAEGATVAWAGAMSGVRAEVNAILSALSSLGGGVISNAGKQAEITALQAGKSIRAAAQASIDLQREATFDARAQGANWFERQVIEFERDVARYGVALDDQLDNERKLARDRGRPSRGSGGGGGSRGGTREANQMLRERDRILDSLKASQDQYADDLADLNELHRMGYLNADQYSLAINQVGEEFEASQPFVQEWKDSLLDAAMGGENAFDSLKESIKRAALEMLLFNTGPLKDLFGRAGGRGLLGGLFGGGGGFMKLLGFRANGGGVKGGGAYMVNENTPNSEVFVPSQSGAVLNVPQAQAALRGQSVRGTLIVDVRLKDDMLDVRINNLAAGVAAKVSAGQISQNNHNVQQMQRRQNGGY